MLVHNDDVLVFVFVRREQASARKGAARKVEGGGNRNIRLMADVLHFRCHIVSRRRFRRKLNFSSSIVHQSYKLKIAFNYLVFIYGKYAYMARLQCYILLFV